MELISPRASLHLSPRAPFSLPKAMSVDLDTYRPPRQAMVDTRPPLSHPGGKARVAEQKPPSALKIAVTPDHVPESLAIPLPWPASSGDEGGHGDDDDAYEQMDDLVGEVAPARMPHIDLYENDGGGMGGPLSDFNDGIPASGGGRQRTPFLGLSVDLQAEGRFRALSLIRPPRVIRVRRQRIVSSKLSFFFAALLFPWPSTWRNLPPRRIIAA